MIIVKNDDNVDHYDLELCVYLCDKHIVNKECKQDGSREGVRKRSYAPWALVEVFKRGLDSR